MQEERLKQDILDEAERYHGKFLLHDESPDGTMMIQQWEPVTPSSVLTLRDVYDLMIHEGYNVDYQRLPITDEQAPEEQDFTVLLRRMQATHPSQHVIFNCQMGRGRTTTGMIVGVMWRSFLRSVDGIPLERPKLASDQPNSEVDLIRGEFQVIMRLIRVLEGGLERKAHADACIDLCGDMQNLREAIKVCMM